MELAGYVESLQRQFALAAEASSEEARMLAERLFPALEAAIRLTLQDALVAAAEEITCELAPGSVEVRLRGREPELIVTPPQADALIDDDEQEAEVRPGLNSGLGEDGVIARINLRLPEPLKARVDAAAASEGVSINSWLVRAAGVALERTGGGRPARRQIPQGSQRYSGWGR